MFCIEPSIVNLIFCVEYDGHDFMFLQPHEDMQVVSMGRDQTRLHHVRRVITGHMVVISDHSNDLRRGGLGNEHYAEPVVNQATSNLRWGISLFLDHNLAAAKTS